MRATHTPMDVNSGPNRKIQCGRNSASSSSLSSFEEFSEAMPWRDNSVPAVAGRPGARAGGTASGF